MDIPAANPAIVGSARQIAALQSRPVETVALGFVAGELERFADGVGGGNRWEGLGVEDVDDARRGLGSDHSRVLRHKAHSRENGEEERTCSHHHHDRCAARLLTFLKSRRKGTLCIRDRIRQHQFHLLL